MIVNIDDIDDIHIGRKVNVNNGNRKNTLKMYYLKRVRSEKKLMVVR